MSIFWSPVVDYTVSSDDAQYENQSKGYTKN